MPRGCTHLAAPYLPVCSLMPFITLGFVGGAVFVGYHLYHLPLMRNVYLYILGALVVWWFSVSGERTVHHDGASHFTVMK